MREEIESRWKRAQVDLESAEKNFEAKIYYVSVFLSQQAAEKALKTLYLTKKKTLIKTHNLLMLAKDLNAPANIITASIELSPNYIITRYPTTGIAIPSELYTEKIAETHLR
ncbi:MAG: HEPN domain-containing protein [Nanoarchaeota archaeon]|nr:HEPN domain-containing protein [Nanoarchaeota archaeon]MBU4300598.1 HEPN domain-containing protein [Nanoarchaeota archaeon]MBU4451744.1 HEPN domain-containing protein [Nanoarchaeota archaeon]MCG2723713.1 HEPN domain-containing protein [archaeon]